MQINSQLVRSNTWLATEGLYRWCRVLLISPIWQPQTEPPCAGMIYHWTCQRETRIDQENMGIWDQFQAKLTRACHNWWDIFAKSLNFSFDMCWFSYPSVGRHVLITYSNWSVFAIILTESVLGIMSYPHNYPSWPHGVGKFTFVTQVILKCFFLV